MSSLADFLTNIANAIRKKNGGSKTINAQDFATEIEKPSIIEKMMTNGNYKPSIPITFGPDEFTKSYATSVTAYAFYLRYYFNKIIIPDSVTSLSTASFGYSMYLNDAICPDRQIIIGKGVKKIISYCFMNCRNAKLIEFQGDISSIEASAFSTCAVTASVNPVVVTFLGCTGVPTLANSNAFSGGATSPGKGIIVVPDSLYDTWIAATNWSAVYTAGVWVFKKESEYLAETANTEEE